MHEVEKIPIVEVVEFTLANFNDIGHQNAAKVLIGGGDLYTHITLEQVFNGSGGVTIGHMHTFLLMTVREYLKLRKADAGVELNELLYTPFRAIQSLHERGKGAASVEIRFMVNDNDLQVQHTVRDKQGKPLR